jgi:hypothetical protein
MWMGPLVLPLLILETHSRPATLVALNPVRGSSLGYQHRGHDYNYRSENAGRGRVAHLLNHLVGHSERPPE